MVKYNPMKKTQIDLAIEIYKVNEYPFLWDSLKPEMKANYIFLAERILDLMREQDMKINIKQVSITERDLKGGCGCK